MRMSGGKGFHCCGLATENTHSANTVLIRGTLYRPQAAALSLFHPGSDDKGVTTLRI